jgi:hypothetical protein
MKNDCANLMPLLTELGVYGDGFCYKHVAPNGARALKHAAFQQSQRSSSSTCGGRQSGNVPTDGSFLPSRSCTGTD